MRPIGDFHYFEDAQRGDRKLYWIEKDRVIFRFYRYHYITGV